jgi:hypothetical protein
VRARDVKKLRFSPPVTQALCVKRLTSNLMFDKGFDLKKYMVVEKFKEGCIESNYERYNAKGRMFPEGLHYLNSWVNKELNVCYQLMESNDPELFYEWFKKWDDFVDFELVPID